MHQAIQAAIQSFDDAAAAERLKVAAAHQAAADAQRAADEAQHNVDQIVAAAGSLRQQVAAEAPASAAPAPVPVAAVGDSPMPPVSLSPGTAPLAGAQPDSLAAAVARVMQAAPPAVPYPTTPPGV